MLMSVFIEPHERGEAIEAYADKLTPEQIAEIEEAPETALVRLSLDYSARTAKVLIIPEG